MQWYGLDQFKLLKISKMFFDVEDFRLSSRDLIDRGNKKGPKASAQKVRGEN